MPPHPKSLLRKLRISAWMLLWPVRHLKNLPKILFEPMRVTNMGRQMNIVRNFRMVGSDRIRLWPLGRMVRGSKLRLCLLSLKTTKNS